MKSLAVVLATLALSATAHAEETLTHTLVLAVETRNVDERVDRVIRAARALQEADGVSGVTIDLSHSRVLAKFSAESSDPQRILGSIERAGFHGVFQEQTRFATGSGRESASLVTIEAK